jgi:site-specific recombinase XerC
MKRIRGDLGQKINLASMEGLSPDRTASSPDPADTAPGIAKEATCASILSPEDVVRSYAAAGFAAPATRAVYDRHFKMFYDWCEANSKSALPADVATLRSFITHKASTGSATPTLLAILCAVRFYNRCYGFYIDPKLVRTLIRSYHRVDQKPRIHIAALERTILRQALAAAPLTLRGARERAILLLGFAAALRRSEIAGLDFNTPSDSGTGVMRIGADGARIIIHQSKGDRRRRGVVKFVPRGGEDCPIAAVEAWLAAAKISDGPVFRRVRRWGQVCAARLSGESVAIIIKSAMRPWCERNEHPFRFSGHSLRLGFVTDAVVANIDGNAIARHLGWAHKSLILRYTRPRDGGDRNFLTDLLCQSHYITEPTLCIGR